MNNQIVEMVSVIRSGMRVQHNYYGPGEVIAVGIELASVSFDIRNGKINAVHLEELKSSE